MTIKTDNRGIEYASAGTYTYDTLPEGWALCGHCGRAWNDSKPTGWTPAPSARCPFEPEPEPEPDAIEKFYAGIEAADAGIRQCFAALKRANVDLAESNLARRLRSIDSMLTDARDGVENYGLNGDD